MCRNSENCRLEPTRCRSYHGRTLQLVKRGFHTQKWRKRNDSGATAAIKVTLFLIGIEQRHLGEFMMNESGNGRGDVQAGAELPQRARSSSWILLFPTCREHGQETGSMWGSWRVTVLVLNTMFYFRGNLVYEVEYSKRLIHPGTGGQSTLKVSSRNEKECPLEMINVARFFCAIGECLSSSGNSDSLGYVLLTLDVQQASSSPNFRIRYHIWSQSTE